MTTAGGKVRTAAEAQQRLTKKQRGKEGTWSAKMMKKKKNNNNNDDDEDDEEDGDA